MSNQKKYEINMCEGPLAGKIILYAVPLILSSVLQLLFNAVDIIVVGRYCGSDSLAAVGSTTSRRRSAFGGNRNHVGKTVIGDDVIAGGRN